MRKSNGPSTEPWGTSHPKIFELEFLSLFFMNCFLFVK